MGITVLNETSSFHGGHIKSRDPRTSLAARLSCLGACGICCERREGCEGELKGAVKGCVRARSN